MKTTVKVAEEQAPGKTQRIAASAMQRAARTKAKRGDAACATAGPSFSLAPGRTH